MITDDVKTRLYDRKTLGLTELKDRFLGYLDDGIRSCLARMYATDGAFVSQVQVTATVAANNQVDVSKSATFSATDGLGNLIGTTAAADARLQAIKIPPSAGTVFHVGLRSAMVETGVERNPQTGDVEYSSILEEIGYLGTPDSVAVEGGGLRITVNSLLESGYDHSGRTVRVWLKPKQDGGGVGPQSLDPSVAIETATVVYSNPNNYVDTVGQFGQSSASLVAADYVVMLAGPLVTRQAVRDLTSEEGTLFLAAVTSVASGNPITVIDHTGQTVFTDISPIVQDFIEIVGTHPKICVRAFSGEADTPQISVMDPNGSTRKFTVDEDGDVYCAGNLTVGGTETVTITEVVIGSVEIGDDCSADTASFWADIILKKGLKAGGGTGHGDLILGDGSEATPGNTIVLDGSTCDLVIGAAANGSVNDLVLQRNDAIAAASSVLIRNAGAGSAVGLQVQGDVTVGVSPGATGPALGIASSTNTWTAQNVSGGLNLSVNDATDRTVTITNAHGTGKASLSVEGGVALGGDLTLSGATAKVGATAGGVPLTFDDAIVTPAGGIPLSSTTEAGGAALVTGAQSILGAIAEIQTIGNNIRQGGVFSLSGLVASDQGSRVCRVSAGSVWVEGKKYVFSTYTDLTIPASSTAYIYISATGVISQTPTKETAFAVDTLPLAVVTTNVSAITLIETIRAGVPRVAQKVSVTVGKDLVDNRVCDFATLTEALNWVKHWASRTDSAGRPEVEVIIVGQTTLASTYALTVEHSGLTIRGARMGDVALGETPSGFGESKLIVPATGFTVASGVTLFGLSFCDLTVVASTASGVFLQNNGGTIRGLKIGDCRTTYVQGSANCFSRGIYVSSGSVAGFVFARNLCERKAASGYGNWIEGNISKAVVVENRFLDLGAAGNQYARVVSFSSGSSGVFSRNYCENFEYGAKFVGNWRICDNRFTAGSLDDADSCAIELAGTGSYVVTGNDIDATYYGINVNSTTAKAIIANNHLHSASIATCLSAALCTINGNVCTGAPALGAIVAQCSDSSISNNVISTTPGLQAGIDSNGTRVAIVGNEITVPAGGTYSIVASGNYNNVSGNVGNKPVSVTGTGSVTDGSNIVNAA